ncbi:TonB-dependent receptor [Pedobacter changchengzhani]|uniref:TonB-dependent receptor n=1 Tax=Pedobacter changchengzhani TaxID=2529274 RepID=A0A4R5MPF6_9SPHI|nr:TonB-dependent receptor [Pedobacter changchengzhani]TDG37578.1 TonB-dependent receptor [Pedobacter changchengzhani]
MMVAFATLLCPIFAMAQFNLSGTISEKNNNVNLSGATVKLKGKSISVASNANGKYEFKNLPAGDYEIVVSFLGYQMQEKTINLQANAEVDFKLNQLAFLANEIVVSATRASANSASTYKNIDKETIQKNNFGQDLPFILDNTPGVVVTSDAGAGVGYTGIRIRGSDATRVNVTLNGIPYNDSESQGTFWVNMPDFASSVDNIQIQRGVGTSTNGAGAFGGSLNIQTTSGETEPYAELNNTYGSFNTWKNTVKVGTGLINDKFTFDARLSRIKSDGFIDRAASNLKSYFLSGAYHGKTDLIRINVFSGTEKTYQAWNGIPESRLNGDVAGMNAYIDRNGLNATDAANLLNSGSRTYNSFTYKDQTDNYSQDHYQLLYAKQFSDKFSFNGALHYTAGKGYYEEAKNAQKLANYGLQPVVIGTTTISKTDLVRRRWLDNDFYGFTYAFNYKPATKLNLTLGGGYNEYKGAHFGQVIYAQYASNGNNDRHYYDNDGFKTDFNTFLKATYIPIEKLNIFADLQYRRIYYDVLGTEKNLNQLNIQDKLNFFNPKFGASYFLNAQANLYASFSVANKEPGRDDYINVVAGTLPKSERLNNVEAGYRFKNEAISAGLNMYGMWYKDQLVVTGKINDVGEYFRQNVAKSYRAGVELDFAYQINKQFSLLTNAAFSKNKIKNFTEFIDDYDNGGQIVNNYSNTDISFSPNSVVSGELVYNPIKALALGFQSKYVGKQYLDNTQSNDRRLKSYWVNNVRLAYDLKFNGVKNINIALLVNNVFNKKYESNGYTYGYFGGGALTTENFYFPQAGTNFMLNLNLKF